MNVFLFFLSLTKVKSTVIIPPEYKKLFLLKQQKLPKFELTVIFKNSL